LDYELVLELLAGAADGCSGVFEDEFGVAFHGERADEVELSLGYFDDGLLGGVTEEELADWSLG
jgi:hypothetical protein